MKNCTVAFVYVLISLSIFSSCNNEDPEPVSPSGFDHGVFILNEGNFSDSDGSLSFFNLDSLTVINHLFEKVNNRPFAGLLQSMRFYNHYGYMIDQLGRLEVIRESDLVSVHSLTSDLDIPRYFAAYENAGYVTDWGPYDGDFANIESRIKVYDLTTMHLVKEIETASRPEDIIILKNKIYVANSATNLVTIYDAGDQSMIKELEVSMGPTRFVPDKRENLWVICTGAYVTTGALDGINTLNDQLIYHLDLSEYQPNGRISINGGGDVIYFMSEAWNPDYSTQNTVYRIQLIFNGMEFQMAKSPEAVVSGKNWYGLGIDPTSDILYIADAAAFQGNGSISRYDLSGDLIDNFIVGRGPRDFVFRSE
jgi:hypothetical protein